MTLKNVNRLCVCIAHTLLILFAGAILVNCHGETSATHVRGTTLLNRAGGIINASRQVRYRIAPSLEDVLSSTSWKTNKRDFFSVGFARHVYWLKIPLKGESENSNWYATARNNRLDYVDFYLVRPERGSTRVSHKAAGDMRPLGPHAPAAYPVFRFSLSRERAAVLYIRIESDTFVSFPMRFMSAEEFGAHRRQTVIDHLLFALLLIPYGLFQLFGNHYIRPRARAYLTIAILMGLSYSLFMAGEGNRWFWPDNIFLKEFAFPFCINLFSCFFFHGCSSFYGGIHRCSYSFG